MKPVCSVLRLVSCVPRWPCVSLVGQDEGGRLSPTLGSSAPGGSLRCLQLLPLLAALAGVCPAITLLLVHMKLA